MAEREKNIHIQPSSSISRTHIFPALLAIAAVSGLCAFVSPPLGPWRVILSNPGMYIDLLALLFLLFMLWSSTKVRMNHVAVNWVRYGLLLWIAGGTFDLMDEIFRQPRWMGYYCEDLLRLSGMLLTAIGIYKIIERINQTDAVPVIASAGIGLDGEIYNVNADTAASRIAGALSAEQFILLSDVRGLYGNFPDEESFIDEINLTNLEKLVKEKKITDGMIPKIEAIKYAMFEGLGQAVLLDGRVPHALLLELFTDKGQGTMINH